MKKLLSVFLIASIFCSTPVMANNNITVKVNNETVNFDVQPQIIDGRTYVPMRAIFKKLGATVEWNEAQKSISSKKDNTTIKLVVGENTIIVNDKEVKIDSPAKVINGRTLVPTRFIAETFGYRVDWNELTKNINITTSQKSQEQTNIDLTKNKPKSTPANVAEHYEDYIGIPDLGKIFNVEGKLVIDNRYAIYNYDLSINSAEVIKKYNDVLLKNGFVLNKKYGEGDNIFYLYHNKEYSWNILFSSITIGEKTTAFVQIYKSIQAGEKISFYKNHNGVPDFGDILGVTPTKSTETMFLYSAKNIATKNSLEKYANYLKEYGFEYSGTSYIDGRPADLYINKSNKKEVVTSTAEIESVPYFVIFINN